MVAIKAPDAPQLRRTEQVDLMRREQAGLGRQVAHLHSITATGFGYPSGPLGTLGGSGREGFLGMVNAALADAGRFAATLPRPASGLRGLFAAQAAVPDEVSAPVLAHFDRWDGNILVDDCPAGRGWAGTATRSARCWATRLRSWSR
jgi:hypothetical protein